MDQCTSSANRARRDLYDIKDSAQAQAAPINEDLRNRMIALEGGGLADLRDRAMVATGYDSLARRREMSRMRVDDLDFDPEALEEGGTILINRSKTDQRGAGRVRFLAPDTLRFVLAWLDAAGITSGFIFRSINHSKLGESISGDAVSDAFKKRARQAGAPAEIVARISGHSARVGAAQDMAAAGVTDAAIQQAGGWEDRNQLLKYIRHIRAKQGGAAQLAARQNRLNSGGPKPTLRLQCVDAIDPALMSRIMAALAPLANVEMFAAA